MTASGLSLRRQLLKGGGWAFSGRVLFILLSLVTSGLLARLLTPAEMGAYFLAVSLVSVLAIVAEMGTGRFLVRTVSAALSQGLMGRVRQAMLKSFGLSGAATLLVFLLLLLPQAKWVMVKAFDSPQLAGAMAATGFFLWVTTWQHVLSELARGFSDIFRATLFDQLLMRLVMTPVLGVLWAMGASLDLDTALWISGGCGLAAALAATAWGLRKYRGLEPGEGSECSNRELLKVGLPLMGATLVPAVVAVLGLWIVTMYRPADEVALFGASLRLAAFILMPKMVVAAVVPPIISQLHSGGEHARLEKLLRGAATLTFVAALAVFLGYALLGKWILHFVFGEFYRDAYALLLVFGLGKVFDVWTGACGLSLMMSNAQNAVLWITLVMGAAMVAGALLLVGPYGAMGVAWASTLSVIGQNILYVLVARRRLGIWTIAGWRLPIKEFWR